MKINHDMLTSRTYFIMDLREKYKQTDTNRQYISLNEQV